MKLNGGDASTLSRTLRQKRVGAIALLAQLGQRIAQRLARRAEDAVEWPIQIHDDVDRGRDRECSEGDRDIGQEITWGQ